MALLLFTNLGAFASHWIDCDLKAKITKIKKFNRLGTSTIVRRDFETNKLVTDERGIILSLKIVKVIKQNEESSCQFDENKTINLYVMPEVISKFKVGKQIQVNYKNIGDFLGRQVSWNIISE